MNEIINAKEPAQLHQQQQDDLEEEDSENLEADQAQEGSANQLEQQQQADDLEQEEDDPVVLPPELMLTAEEHADAWHIKETIENIWPELDNLSDYMYGTLAIVADGDMEKAMEIATNMQDFRKDYDILHTLEDGLRHMNDICAKQPNGERFLLAIDEDAEHTIIFVLDLPKLDLRNYTSPDQIQRFFKGFYYIFRVLSPDFRSLRDGHVALIECEGYKWKNNMMDVDFLKQIFRPVGTVPVKVKKLMFFNSPMLANTMVSLAKSVLPRQIAKTIQLGCRAPRLDQLYNTPSAEVAEQRLVLKVEELLLRRYQNERNYCLSVQALEAEDF